MRHNENILAKVESKMMSIIGNLGRPVCAWDVVNNCVVQRPACPAATYQVMWTKKSLTPVPIP